LAQKSIFRFLYSSRNTSVFSPTLSSIREPKLS
jgi:hypothetical protein